MNWILWKVLSLCRRLSPFTCDMVFAVCLKNVEISTDCITIGLLNLEWSNSNFSMAYNYVWTLCFAFVTLVLPLFTSIFYYC